MPKIKNGEKRSEYLERCIPYVIKNEGLDQKAAIGKCEGMYSEHKKKAAASLGVGKDDEILFFDDELDNL